MCVRVKPVLFIQLCKAVLIEAQNKTMNLQIDTVWPREKLNFDTHHTENIRGLECV